MMDEGTIDIWKLNAWWKLNAELDWSEVKRLMKNGNLKLVDDEFRWVTE